MRTFIAVMKDSLREAVDGFVIYVMLGLALLTIVAVALISFQPDTAETGFPSLVGNFSQVFRNRGADAEEVGTRIKIGPITVRTPIELSYSVVDVQKLDSGAGYAGKYKLRLIVSPPAASSPGARRGGNPPRAPAIQEESTIFPTVVYAWSQAKTPEQYFLIKDPSGDGDNPAPVGKMPQFEMVPDDKDPDEALAAKVGAGGRWTLVSVPKVSPKEFESVTDATMEDFIRNQFLIHGDIDGVTVKRKAGVEKPHYQFDVEAEVKHGAKGWPHTTKFFFGQMTMSQSKPFGPAVYLIQDLLVNTLGASITLLIAVILTGFFIPNMLRKGSLDLLVAKPIARWQLLLFKYLGGLLFMLMVSTLSVGGVWLVMAIRTGNWNPTFLLSIPIFTFTFAVLYAMSTLIAVLTRSAIAAILITAVFLVLMWGVAITKSISDGVRTLAAKEEDKKGTFYTIIDVTNMVLPRYNDMLKLNGQQMAEAYCTQSVAKANGRVEQPSWASTIVISMIYVLVFLSLSYWRFATRDP